MAKAEYNVGNYSTRHKTLKKILNQSEKKFNKTIAKLQKGKVLKIKVKVKNIKHFEDDYMSEADYKIERDFGV